MKQLFILFLFIGVSHYGKTQTIDPGLKDCLKGNYTHTDNAGNKHHLKLTASLTTEYTGYVYEGSNKNAIGNRPFVMFGQWGADENTVNILTGTFKNAEKYKNDKKAPEYYAWQHQNTGSKGAYDLEQGTIVFMGNTYTRDEGPCSQMRLKEHKESRQNQTGNTQVEIPAPSIDYEKGRLVKDEYLDLLSSLAEDSKSLHFKNMVDQMHSNRDNYAQGRDVAMQLGTFSQDDIDVLNFFENASQVVALADYLIKERSGTLTPEQSQARSSIRKLFSELQTVYNEVDFVPNFYEFDKSVPEQIDVILQNIDKYNSATSVRRLLYLEYWSTQPYMTIDQLSNRLVEIENLKTTKGTQHILSMIEQKQRSFNDNFFNPVLNKERGFKSTFNRLKLREAHFYKLNGNKDKANEIRASVDYDVHNFDAFRLLNESFEKQDYHSSLQYYEQVKEVAKANEGGGHFFISYHEVPNIFADYNGTSRVETAYLLGLGALSHYILLNESQALDELNYLKQYNENHRVFNENYKNVKRRKKADNYNDVELASSYALCLAIEKTIEANFCSRNGQFDQARTLTEEAINLIEEYPEFGFEHFTPWIHLTRFEILIRTGDLTEAKKEAVKIKPMTYSIYNASLFSVDDYNFLLALLKFKQGQFQTCLNQIKTIEASNGATSKTLLLKLKTYQAIGDDQSAQEILEIINNK